jgi:hypothetical protein
MKYGIKRIRKITQNQIKLFSEPKTIYLSLDSLSNIQPTNFIKTNYKFSDTLIYDKFEEFNLQIVGGEPTAYEGLDLALRSIRKDPRKLLALETNGTKPLAWWQDNL